MTLHLNGFFVFHLIICNSRSAYLAPKIYIHGPAEGSKGLKINPECQEIFKLKCTSNSYMQCIDESLKIKKQINVSKVKLNSQDKVI